MPSSTKIPIQTWERPPETKEELDWADLTTVDLTPFREGDHSARTKVADDLKHAVNKVGFWAVVGTGIDDEEVKRISNIGHTFFQQPIETKRQYPCDFANGNYFGYREPIRDLKNSGVKENAEALNMPKITKSMESEWPRHEIIMQNLDEIEAFQRKVYQNVIEPLFILFALILELPERYFVDKQPFDCASEDHLRWMSYKPNSADVDKKINNEYLHGHTDFGMCTLLFQQNVAGLQILTPNEEWKYVRTVPNGIVINTADVLSLLSKGHIKSTVHRVVRPPSDQVQYHRLGLFYFVRVANDLPMLIPPSPLLKRLGLWNDEEEEKQKEEKPITGLEFTRARVEHSWNRSSLYDQEHRKGFRIGNFEVRTGY